MLISKVFPSCVLEIKKIMFWAQQSHINFNVHKHGQALAIIARENSDILPCHPWFPHKMMSEKQHRNSILMTHHYILRSGKCVWLVKANFTRCTTNQKHYPDLGWNASSVWNFCTRFSDVISWANQRWRREMLAVFSGYDHKKSNLHASCCPHGFINKI